MASEGGATDITDSVTRRTMGPAQPSAGSVPIVAVAADVAVEREDGVATAPPAADVNTDANAHKNINGSSSQANDASASTPSAEVRGSVDTTKRDGQESANNVEDGEAKEGRVGGGEGKQDAPANDNDNDAEASREMPLTAVDMDTSEDVQRTAETVAEGMEVEDDEDEDEHGDRENKASDDDGEQGEEEEEEEEDDRPTHVSMDPAKMTAYLATLKKGDEIDMYCVRTKEWVPAKVESAQNKQIQVHYMGWKKTTDETIAYESGWRLAPRESQTPAGWKRLDDLQAKKKRSQEEKRKQQLEAFERKQQGDPVDQMPATGALQTTFVEAGLTRSGRKITKRILNEATFSRKKKKLVPAETALDGSATSESAVVLAPTKRTAKEIAAEMQEDSLCGVCGELEDEDLSDKILCDGGCLNAFHVSCVGAEDVPEDEKWLCEQCRTNEQPCFACDRFGTVDGKGGVFRCSVASCGKFYHQNCVNANKLSRRFGRAKSAVATTTVKSSEDLNSTKAEDTETAETTDESDDTNDSAFRCPRHVCSVCENAKKGSELMFCLKCPEAYHPHCVPPSARYNNIGLLCSRHPDCVLPRIPDSFLADRNFDSVVVDSSLRLPTLFVPKEDPVQTDVSDAHHFRLPLDVMESVRMQPPSYRKLARSMYTFKQPKPSLEDVPVCVCKTHCGDDCINRLSFTECFGPAPLTPGQPFVRGDKNKESNCPLGEQCGNRALHQRVYAKFQRFHSIEKGWGLKITEPVKAGQLVIEYVGEVIDEKEKEFRLSEHARRNPEDKNMYIMELSNGVYIDARHKGSESRLINHSCDPNCHLLKWNVRGVNRIAITALKDIAEGEELSYDYQFHTSQALEWRCYCKASNCRGTMAPRALNGQNGNGDGEDDGKKLTKKEKLKRMKRAMLQERLQLEKEEKATALRLNCTPGISRSMPRTGPVPREMKWARMTHAFLARNAIQGYDFLARRQLFAAANAFAPGPTDTQKTIATDVKMENGAVLVSESATDKHSTSTMDVKMENGASEAVPCDNAATDEAMPLADAVVDGANDGHSIPIGDDKSSEPDVSPQSRVNDPILPSDGGSTPTSMCVDPVASTETS